MTDTTLQKKATVSCPFCGTLNRVDLGRLGDRPKCGECGRPLLLDRPQPVPGDVFDRVLSGTDVPVLIDFYADWCGPCKIMAPVLDELARDRMGELFVGKLDTDRHPDVSQRFDVRGIPTLILFQSGREVARRVGAVPRRELDAMLTAARASPGATSAS
ncbi:MAG TPA: thioredoxin [Gemmatimonadales bacterium]